MCSSHTHCTHTTPCTASLHPKPACILPPEPFLHHGCTQASRRDNSGSLLGTHGGFSRDEPVGPPAARLAHSSAPQQCWLCKLPSRAPPGPRPGTSSLPPPAAPAAPFQACPVTLLPCPAPWPLQTEAVVQRKVITENNSQPQLTEGDGGGSGYPTVGATAGTQGGVTLALKAPLAGRGAIS